MSNGSTYSIVPFINKEAIGSVAGIVGAGGNIGAMLAGFLFKSSGITYVDAFLYIGICVAVVGVAVFLVNISNGGRKETLHMTDSDRLLKRA